MRVVVFGATGNVGSSLVRALVADERADEVVGVARRLPRCSFDRVRWMAADIVVDDLDSLVVGADAVVHLAWLIQPSHDENTLRRVNVEGSRRVFEATLRVGVPTLVYASSVGVYSRGPKEKAVDESWPAEGISSSFYARHKAEVESTLDDLERDNPGLRVVRLRPGLIFKRSAASGVRRLFVGPFLPGWALRPGLVPLVPAVSGLRVQAVHADDVAEAYREAIFRDVRGAFNVAADPPLDSDVLGRVLGARPVQLNRDLARSVLSLLWRLHLQPTSPGWFDLALSVPLIDSSRARRELGWAPRQSAEDALRELLAGLREGAGEEMMPPLSPDSGGRFRLREIVTGVGSRTGQA